MYKILSIIVILGFLAAGSTAIADIYQSEAILATIFIAKNDKAKKSQKGKNQSLKDCHTNCREQHSAGIQECIDSGQKPLSKCIQKVNDRKKECLKGCKQ